MFFAIRDAVSAVGDHQGESAAERARDERGDPQGNRCGTRGHVRRAPLTEKEDERDERLLLPFRSGGAARWRAPRAAPMHIVLFGAGHVGHALIELLGNLPCVVQWVDERDELFPDETPANVQIEATDTPDAIVDAAPPGAGFS